MMERILKEMPTIAVVGFSSVPTKAGYYVPDYLHNYGYHIIPVNPNLSHALGVPAYPALSAIPDPVDVVQIFRQPRYVLPFIEEAIAIGARAIWLQQGITSAAGKQLAEAAGVLYVEDRCMLVEHRHVRQSGWDGTPRAVAVE
jgi:predicted CoA-binding protein